MKIKEKITPLLAVFKIIMETDITDAFEKGWKLKSYEELSNNMKIAIKTYYRNDDLSEFSITLKDKVAAIEVIGVLCGYFKWEMSVESREFARQIMSDIESGKINLL